MDSIINMTLYFLLYLYSDSFSPHNVKRTFSFCDLHYSEKVKSHKVAVVNSHNTEIFIAVVLVKFPYECRSYLFREFITVR